LLAPLIEILKKTKEVTTQLVVTGSHLENEFGKTVIEIEADGHEIISKVNVLQKGDDAVSKGKSIADGINGLVDVFDRLSPDLVVLLGDRYEILAAAQSALMMNIPIAHIHGGEATEGTIDESIRHSITKMAYLHFTATEVYRRRVIQMGEVPERVFNVGAPGIDNVLTLPVLKKEELFTKLNLSLNEPFLLVTYHPVTRNQDGGLHGLNSLLSVIEKRSDLSCVITMANADAGGKKINRDITAIARKHPKRVITIASLGRQRYLSLMRYASAIVGNSSSGIIEAPTVGTPTVNIGNRQHGRLCAPSIISCGTEIEEIEMGINSALDPKFRTMSLKCDSPYGAGGASKRIAEILQHVDLPNSMVKIFYDLPNLF